MIQQTEKELEIERSILGCILEDSTLLDECTLQDKHFHCPKHKAIYRAIRKVEAQGLEIDVMSIGDTDEKGIDTPEAYRYMIELSNSMPSTANFLYFQKRLIEMSSVRKVNKKIQQFMAEPTKELGGVEQLVNELQVITEDMAKSEQQETTAELFANLYQKHLTTKAHGLSGINTGFDNINRLVDGWQCGDLIIVGARPSMGKTALSLSFMIEGLRMSDDTYAHFFSCEMPKEQILNRIIASLGKINVSKLRNPNKTFNASDWNKYNTALGKIEQLNTRFSISETYNVMEIRSEIRRIKKDNPDKKCVFFIDHLDHVRTTGTFNSKNQEVGEIVHELKQITKKENVAIVLLCQLNRMVEKQQDKRPTMADLRDSGSIEQIADVVILLYREGYYDKENAPSEQEMELIFDKNRNGSTGKQKLTFIRETNSFYDKR